MQSATRPSNPSFKATRARMPVLTQDKNSLQEIEPTCVLDFYVHESCQRRGIGKELFEVRGCGRWSQSWCPS